MTVRVAIGGFRVAPREIFDLVYRCARVAGFEAGSAERAARNVTASEIVCGDAIKTFLRAMENKEEVRECFADGPDLLAAAEVAARQSGFAEVSLPRPIPLAALIQTIDEVRGRGLGVAGVPSGGSGSTAVESLEIGGPAQQRFMDDEKHGKACRHGVLVDEAVFTHLEKAAHLFLVSEEVLDAVDG